MNHEAFEGDEDDHRTAIVEERLALDDRQERVGRAQFFYDSNHGHRIRGTAKQKVKEEGKILTVRQGTG